MPRRHKTQGSAGRAKTDSKPHSKSSNGANNVKPPKNRLKDQSMQDEQDIFFEGRDEILLDGSNSARSRDLEDYDDEEEVFALKGLDESASESGSDSADEPHDESDAGDSEDETTTAPIPTAKPSKKAKAIAKSQQTAEEEDEDTSEEGEERWGKNKSAYYASAGQIAESEDEEALELEEAEALRLQTKSREAIAEADFGLNDMATTNAPSNDETASKPLSLRHSPKPIVTPRDKQTALRELERTNPEVLALAREWEDVAPLMAKLNIAVQKKHDLDPNHPTLGMYYLHQQTLLTYATVLAHYLHVRLTPVPGPSPSAPTTARPVPDKVLERLFELRNALSILEDIGFSALGLDDDDPTRGDEDEDDELDGMEEEEMMFANGDYGDEETAAIMQEIEEARRESETLNKKRAQRLKKATAKNPSPGSQDDSVAVAKSEKKKKKTKDKSSPPTPTPKSITFDLVEPEFGSYAKSSLPPTSTSSQPSSSTSAPYDPFSESTSLSNPDLLDKSTRRKSLKFHTSRIESASKRREAARSNALGGDDDIPWTDRKAERRKKEQEDALKRKGLGMGGDDLDDGGGEEEENNGKGKKRARDEDDDLGEDGEGEDGYYELVKKGKKQAKIEKKAAYEAERAANRPDFAEEDASGPRSVTRAIMKNRGMTPKRAKSVRNPRVKKKIRFEQAKKKVSSKRAVFKGGMASLPGGRYEGERSGISKVVKSVKLS